MQGGKRQVPPVTLRRELRGQRRKRLLSLCKPVHGYPQLIPSLGSIKKISYGLFAKSVDWNGLPGSPGGRGVNRAFPRASAFLSEYDKVYGENGWHPD